MGFVWFGVFLVGSFFWWVLVLFFVVRKKSPETIEEPYLFSVKSHLDLIEDTSFENDRSHSVACVVSCTAYGKLPDQLNMNILAKFKPVR